MNKVLLKADYNPTKRAGGVVYRFSGINTTADIETRVERLEKLAYSEPQTYQLSGLEQYGFEKLENLTIGGKLK